jgi:hypothetical protein
MEDIFDNTLDIEPLDLGSEDFSLQATEVSNEEDILALTGEALPTLDAKALFAQGDTQAWNNLLETSRAFGADINQLSDDAKDLFQKQQDVQDNPKVNADVVSMVPIKAFTAVDLRFTANLRYAQMKADEISKRTEEATGDSFGEKAFDFVDRYLFRQGVGGGVLEDLSGRSSRKSREILAAMANLSPEEFTKWFDAYGEEVASEGFFTGNNIFAAKQLQEELQLKGFDPSADQKVFGAVFDIATGAIAGGVTKAVTASARKLGSIVKANTAVARVTAAAGSEAGGKAGLNILGTQAHPPTLGAMGPGTHNLVPDPVLPPNSVWTRLVAGNELVAEIKHVYQSNALGRVVPLEVVEAEALRLAQKRVDSISNILHNNSIRSDGFGNHSSIALFGKIADGEPFLPFRRTKDSPWEPTASLKQRALDIGDNARVVPFDENDISKGYLIEVTDPIDVVGLVPGVDSALVEAHGLIRGTIGRVFGGSFSGSTATRDAKRSADLGYIGESGESALRQAARPYEKAFESRPAKSKFAIRAVYSELRDGLHADTRVHYTEDQFKALYQQKHPNGTPATDKDYAAYHALTTIEDAAWIQKSVVELQRYIHSGYVSVVETGPGINVPAKRIAKADIPADDFIKDIKRNRVHTRDLWGDDLAEDAIVWRLDSRLDTGEQYITAPSSVRAIEHTDVVGYNPGGTRSNPRAKFFVVIGAEGGRLKTLLSATTEKSARRAELEIDTISKAAVRNDPDIDRIIKENNHWNPDIDSRAAWDAWLKKEGWDLGRGTIRVRERDYALLPNDLGGGTVHRGSTLSDFITNELRRSDKVLPHFGGSRAYNIDPAFAVAGQYASAAHTFANRAWSVGAMNGWVKKALETNPEWFPPNAVNSSNYDQLFRDAVIPGGSTSSYVTRMRELRNITLRRMNTKDEATLMFERGADKVEQYVFDITGASVRIPNVINIALKMGFQTTFGFLAPAQLFMQAFHATTIIAISPLYGFKGAASVVGVKSMLKAPDKATYNLLRTRFSKRFGISEAQTEELMEYTRTSGRNVVGGETMEDGSAVGRGLSSWNGEDLRYSARRAAIAKVSSLANEGLEAGTYFFKAGERISRLTAINTAAFEHFAKHPTIGILSEKGRSMVASREGVLSFNMTTKSRGAIQSGLLKVPTQWISYTLRSMEAIFFGKDLSKWERRRLFTVMMPFYGLSGFGGASAAGYIAEQVGLTDESNPAIYTLLKTGFLDAMMVELMGAENAPALGGRLAPFGFISEFRDKISQNELSALGGPSMEIGGNILGAFWDTMGHLANGRTTLFTEDLMKVLRQPSGIDGFFKAAGILRYGIYKSKNGTPVPGEMTITNAISVVLGITPLRVTEYWGAFGDVYRTDKYLSQVRKETGKRADEASLLYDIGTEDSIARGNRLIEETIDLINVLGASEFDREALRKSLARGIGDKYIKVVNRLYQKQRFATAGQLMALIEGKQ